MARQKCRVTGHARAPTIKRAIHAAWVPWRPQACLFIDAAEVDKMLKKAPSKEPPHIPLRVVTTRQDQSPKGLCSTEGQMSPSHSSPLRSKILQILCVETGTAPPRPLPLSLPPPRLMPPRLMVLNNPHPMIETLDCGGRAVVKHDAEHYDAEWFELAAAAGCGRGPQPAERERLG